MARPDVLKRKLPSSYQGGMFRWTVLHGSRSLIARTEARRLGYNDLVGFNCFGCCGQNPWVEIDPDYVEFYPGESPYFEACLSYNTCSGDMGPYPETPDSTYVPSPFSWDAVRVSAWDASMATLSFSVVEEKVLVNCQTEQVTRNGSGMADTCKYLVQGRRTDRNCPAETAFCASCLGCCQSWYNYDICKGRSPQYAQPDYDACRGACFADKNDCPR